MKIYIVGAVASGKSTLARELSGLTGIPYTSLDEVVHIPDKSNVWEIEKDKSMKGTGYLIQLLVKGIG